MNRACISVLVMFFCGLLVVSCLQSSPDTTAPKTSENKPVPPPDTAPPIDVTQSPTVTPQSPKLEAVPTTLDNFTTVTDGIWDVQATHGSLTFAATDVLASDQKIAKLTFSGGQTNAAGPGNSTQLSSKLLMGFGVYRARVNFAKCAAGEELVNGIFTYSYGGTNGLPLDSNNNNITDNNEIDIELQCGRSNYLWLTTWTDYQANPAPPLESFRKVSRVFDLTTGKAYQTPAGKEDTYDVDFKTVVTTIPEMAIPTLAIADAYYELGFEWRATSLRYFMMINGADVTLWNFTDAKFIPQNEAFMMFNLWHTPNNWAPPASNTGTYPANDQSLKVDWFKHWAN